MHPYIVSKSLWLCLLLCTSFGLILNGHIYPFNNQSVSTEKLHQPFARSIYITTTDLKLHQGRSTAAKVLVEIPKGKEVKVLDSSFGQWWQIQYNGKTGYVISSYLKYSTRNNLIDHDPLYNYSSLYNSKPTYATKSILALREYDSSTSAIITQIPKGKKVKVLNSGFGAWWQVHYKGRTGYVQSNQLTHPENDQLVERSPYPASSKSTLSKPNYVTTSVLNMRSSKSQSATIVMKIPNGAGVKLINSNFGDWMEVEYQGKTGYLPSAYCRPLQQAVENISQDNATPGTNTVKAATHIITKATSLRAKPADGSEVYLRFSAGDQVLVLDDSGEWWWKVHFKGKKGWVKKRLLQKN